VSLACTAWYQAISCESCYSWVSLQAFIILVSSLTCDRDEHFYQLGLRQFAAFNRLRLDPPPDLRELLQLAAEDEPGIVENGLHVDDVVEVRMQAPLMT